MANSEGGSMSSGDDSEVESRIQDFDRAEKKKKPGIVFLSSVPEGMNVSETTSFFAEFGRVGRVFLQPDVKLGMRRFTEGWIEFLSKKIAKRVAQQVNNTPVVGKRKHKQPQFALWNIKYLPRFKWVHLSERLAYEKAVKQQRLRTEISQVKREAEQFKGSVRQQKKRKKKREEQSPAAKRIKEDAATEPEESKEPKLFFFKQEESFVAKKHKMEEESPGGRAKKSKKDKKTKEIKELSPQSKSKKDKKVAKKKKRASGKKYDFEAGEDNFTGKNGEDSQSTAVGSNKRPQRRSSDDSGSTSKKTDLSQRKRGGESSGGGGGASLRKSGEVVGDRAAFLKSVFGGGTYTSM